MPLALKKELCYYKWHLMKSYEILGIFAGNLDTVALEGVVNDVKKLLEQGGAQGVRSESTPQTHLAYPVGRSATGAYVRFIFEALPSAIPLLQRRLTLARVMLRFMITQYVAAPLVHTVVTREGVAMRAEPIAAALSEEEIAKKVEAALASAEEHE